MDKKAICISYLQSVVAAGIQKVTFKGNGGGGYGEFFVSSPLEVFHQFLQVETENHTSPLVLEKAQECIPWSSKKLKCDEVKQAKGHSSSPMCLEREGSARQYSVDYILVTHQ